MVKEGKDVECVTGIQNFDQHIVKLLMDRKEETLAMDDFTEWKRLHTALQRLKEGKNRAKQEDDD
jgi:hypothetical protein